MKKTSLLILFGIALCFRSVGQVFDVDTLLYNGDNQKHINMVILSDGYTQNELPTFKSVARDVIDEYFKASPYINYKNYFNVYIIKVPSSESGVNHPGTANCTFEGSYPELPIVKVDNYFGSSFDSNGIHRLLLPSNTERISSVLAANLPDYDLAIMFVNSPVIAGSGGDIATLTAGNTTTTTLQLLLHELGHSFALLRDEYWPGPQYAKEAANMTMESDPSIIRWKNWLGTNGINIYSYGSSPDSKIWFKPHNECQMQYLEVPFCSVCKEAIIERIHSLTSTVEEYFPIDTTLESPPLSMSFKVCLIEPVPNTLKRTWLLNGKVFGRNIDSLALRREYLKTGLNKIELVVEDTTQLIRVDNHTSVHISTVTWHIDRGVVGIRDVTVSPDELRIDLYPNPVSDILNIRIQNDKKWELHFEIYDLQGRRIKQGILSDENLMPADLSEQPRGTYLVRILSGKSILTIKKIIKI